MESKDILVAIIFVCIIFMFCYIAYLDYKNCNKENNKNDKRK